MTLFGGRLPIISVTELMTLTATVSRMRLEVALCKELDKQVVRVTQFMPDSDTTVSHGLLVDEACADYFVAGRTAEAVRQKLLRTLGRYMPFFELTISKTAQLSLFGIAEDAHSGGSPHQERQASAGGRGVSKSSLLIS